MRRIALIASIALLGIAARCVPAKPHPPMPSSYHLQVKVTTGGQARPDALVYRDNVPSEDPNKGGVPTPVDGAGAHDWGQLPDQGLNVCAMGPGATVCVPGPLHQDLSLTIELPPIPALPPPPPPTPIGWTREQLQDFQGDLMIWAPEVGCAPEARIHCDARGLQAGWVWTLTLPRFNHDHRDQLLKKAKAQGWTHWPVQVTMCHPGAGYHDLLPVTPDDCSHASQDINSVLHEVRTAGLVPVCTGVGPDDPLQPGVEVNLCPIALPDWDNSGALWGRLKGLAQAFPPTTLLYLELPFGQPCPQATGGDEPVVPVCQEGGGAWLREAQRRYPNFVGVLYELDEPGSGMNEAYLRGTHAWFRDVQEVLFETDTYWKFWQGLPEAQQRGYNDGIMGGYPWLKGCLSGCSTHAAPQALPTGGAHFEGTLPWNEVTSVHIAGDWGQWAVTTQITKVDVSLDGLHIDMDNGRPDAWPESTTHPGMGGIQQSYGLVERINGQWYASAPIQLWKGLQYSGGPIQKQDVGDGSGRGQIAANWFYDARWGPMGGRQPQPDEVIGVFVCAGDCRDANGDWSVVHERSNIVLFKLPAPGMKVVFTQ